MTTSLDTDRIAAAARALLDDKVTAVRTLAEARQKREDARSALSDAERGDTTAYTAALKAGWTTDELKRVGLDAPSKRAPGRPRSNRRGAAASTSTAPTSTSDDTAAG
ncbi:hypothetical protein [Jannaschia sp. R86511]|uniref:hypothetical protein n=1 Tax=Jannaschia sp. R86511 TaxID=3093853 RepID=UPI0036D3A6B6